VALVLAALVVTATPAAAASANLVVASQLSSTAEFSSGSFTNATTATVNGEGGVAFGGTAQRPADDSSGSTTNKVGIVIEPETDLNGIKATLSSTTTGATQAYLETTSGTVLDTATVSGAGDTVTFSASLSAGTQYRVVVDDNGDSFQLGWLDATSYPYQSTLVDIVDGYESGLSSSDAFAFRSVTALSDTGSYTTPNQSVSEIEEVAINVTTVRDSDLTLYAEYWDGSAWVTANQTTVTTAGNKTLGVAATAETWRVRASFTGTGGAPDAFIGDVSWLFDAQQPTGSNISPGDGTKLTGQTTTFTVDVADPDFATGQGDSVTATLYVDGTAVGSETVTQNQTATVEHSVAGGGDHSFYWVLTDEYGESSTTATRTVSAPSQLSIYNESNSSELLNQTTFDVTLYFDNGTGPAIVEERTVSDGTVNLTGLPAGEDFVVSVEGDGWVNRRIVVPSIYDTQRVYMLNSSVDTTPVVFKLEDFTGTFPQDETVLLVERGVNGTYQTVLGDEFGATGQFPATLATGVRHRLVLLNTETGERRVAGTYTPLAGGEQTITVSPSDGVSVLDSGPTIAWIPGTDLLPATDSAQLGARLENRSATITSWSVTATHVPETGTNSTLWTYSASTNGGRATTTENLSGLSGQVILNVTYSSDTGVTTSDVRAFTLQDQSDAFGFSLLGQMDSAPGALLPSQDVSAFQTAVALMLAVLSMAVVAVSTNTTSELTAGAGVLILGGFSVVGWVGYPLVVTSGVAWLGLTAIRRGVI